MSDSFQGSWSASTPRVASVQCVTQDEVKLILEEHDSAMQVARGCMQRLLLASGRVAERPDFDPHRNAVEFVMVHEPASRLDELHEQNIAQLPRRDSGFGFDEGGEGEDDDAFTGQETPPHSDTSAPTGGKSSGASRSVRSVVRFGDPTQTSGTAGTDSNSVTYERQTSFMKTCTEVHRALRKKVDKEYKGILVKHEQESRFRGSLNSLGSMRSADTQTSHEGNVAWYVMLLHVILTAESQQAQWALNTRFLVNVGRLLVAADAILICGVTLYSLDKSIASYNEKGSGGGSEVELPCILWYAEVCINVVFACELVLNVAARGLQFFYGQDHTWNTFEAFLVIGSCTEMVARNFLSTNAVWIRNFRMLRVFRVLRMMRVFKFAMGFRHLRLITLAVMQSTVPLFWAFTFLVFLLYLFSIIFLQGVTQYIETAVAGDIVVTDLQKYFGSMSMALLTLFMSISGGVSWWDVASPLKEVSAFYLLMFVLFILVMIFAISNIITGIFVNDAVDMANWDKAIVQQLEKERTGEALKELKQLFNLADEDMDDSLSCRDLEKFLKRDEVKAVLVTLGLHISDSRSFFHLLDVDESGNVQIDEFVVGCLRLRGKAERLDFERMMFEHRRLLNKLQADVSRLVTSLVAQSSRDIQAVQHSILSARRSAAFHRTRHQRKENMDPIGDIDLLMDFDVSDEIGNLDDLDLVLDVEEEPQEHTMCYAMRDTNDESQTQEGTSDSERGAGQTFPGPDV